MNIPKENEIYRHFKGQLYSIVTVAQHSETGEQLVIYRALYGDGKVYARPLDMFMSPVDKAKYPGVTQRDRFEKVTEANVNTVFGSEKTNASGENAVTEEKTAEVKDAAEIKETAEIKDAAEATGKAKVIESAVNDPDAEEKLDPKVDEFIMADTYEQKLEILYSIRNRVTDDMLNTMAMTCEVTLEEGSVAEKYESLKKALLIYEKYECNRLR